MCETEREVSMEFDLDNPSSTPLQEPQCDEIETLFASESDHMPSKNLSHFNLSVRRQAISSISQFSRNLDPFIPYLAVHYFDRFISTQSMPFLEPKPWILNLLAMSCVSLAAKMNKIEFSQGDGGVIFDSQSIHRTELLILDALKWRMRSVTPFSFMEFFLPFFTLKADPPLAQALKARATEVLFKIQHETKMLGFRPSVAAASALLHASHELLPSQFRNAILSCAYVDQDELTDCSNAIEDAMVDSGCEEVMRLDTLSCSDTPRNVLDRHYSSSESERTSRDRDVKRRKISDVCNSVMVSQFRQSF
ncbi:hypothetical protein Scep_013255 [Stephania cephalantha]|uniref:Cyclin C-terminal domain-containing protein n=1 Tax=Stephania cephalantha TaxID=152367 RepID=A0AAP0JJ08_9MAGN